MLTAKASLLQFNLNLTKIHEDGRVDIPVNFKNCLKKNVKRSQPSSVLSKQHDRKYLTGNPSPSAGKECLGM